MTTVKWSFNYYLGFIIIGSPSLTVVLVSVFASGDLDTSSAVQEFKDTHTKLNKNSFTKKLVFIKNQFKN
jgi:hypothetical protein